MKYALLALLVACDCCSPLYAAALSFGSSSSSAVYPREQQAGCQNSATSRSCWGDFSIDTDYYSSTPNTGVTKEYWLSVENTTLAPDGYERQVLTFNGTIPGPTITANWGDSLVVHVTNNLKDNGTSVHWHGIRQLNNTEHDGVPGVTQCPIAPGGSLTYRFRATQYGSTWFHSHFSLQYGNGLFGSLVINGPATADYDEDLGTLFLTDWAHESTFGMWDAVRRQGPPSLPNGLINGTNTYDCSTSDDPKCTGGGQKFEMIFVAGQKYRVSLVNVAINGHFQFSIDGHNLTVIASDLVPIVPYQTNSVLIVEGQRYDVIIEANAEPDDYWLRGGWQQTCSPNENSADITGILRYNSSSTAKPTTSGITVGDYCGDEPLTNLVPHFAIDVGSYSTITQESLEVLVGNYVTWTINSSSLYLNWSEPTSLRIYNEKFVFPTDYNVVSVDRADSNDEWQIFVLEDKSGAGLAHPIHLHGHDFWVLAQDTGSFNSSTANLNLKNPPRRDTASLPADGYLAVAFKKDNPGSWLMHCHVAWHSSQGFGLQFVERESEIAATITNVDALDGTCEAWNSYVPTEAYPQDDAGI